MVLLVSSGCGSGGSTAHLSGNVTLGGQPIPADATAAMSFTAIGDNTAEAVNVPIENGAYDSPNTPRGEVLVKFYITQPVGPMKKSERTGKEYRESKDLVPAEHAAGMQITVDGDDQNKDFSL